MPEDKKVDTKAADTGAIGEEDNSPKPYILKKGQRHSEVVEGNRFTYMGDGEGTIMLTPQQAINFGDKLVSPTAADAAVKLTPEDGDAFQAKQAFVAPDADNMLASDGGPAANGAGDQVKSLTGEGPGTAKLDADGAVVDNTQPAAKKN